MKHLLTVHSLHRAITLFMRATIIAAMAGALLASRWMTLFVSSLALFLTFLPAIVRRNYKIYLTSGFELIVVIFIYTSLFLGGVHDYYTKFWWWDVVLHTSSGIALGFIGFLILYVLNEEKKVSATPGVIVLFAFSFAVALGAVWEIFEFAMDQWFGTDMQSSGIVDTMWDLIVDTAGALLTSVIGYLYLKGGKTRVFSGMVDRFVEKNPHLFSKTK